MPPSDHLGSGLLGPDALQQPPPSVQPPTPTRSSGSREAANATRVTCEVCGKELCNKYFLKTHMAKIHGTQPGLHHSTGRDQSSSSHHHHQSQQQQQHHQTDSRSSASSNDAADTAVSSGGGRLRNSPSLYQTFLSSSSSPVKPEVRSSPLSFKMATAATSSSSSGASVIGGGGDIDIESDITKRFEPVARYQLPIRPEDVKVPSVGDPTPAGVDYRRAAIDQAAVARIKADVDDDIDRDVKDPDDTWRRKSPMTSGNAVDGSTQKRKQQSSDDTPGEFVKRIKRDGGSGSDNRTTPESVLQHQMLLSKLASELQSKTMAEIIKMSKIDAVSSTAASSNSPVVVTDPSSAAAAQMSMSALLQRHVQSQPFPMYFGAHPLVPPVSSAASSQLLAAAAAASTTGDAERPTSGTGNASTINGHSSPPTTTIITTTTSSDGAGVVGV